MKKSLAQSIIERKRKKKLSENSDMDDITNLSDNLEPVSLAKKRNQEVAGEEIYDDDLEDFPQPEGSNTKGPTLENMSMLQKIRARMKSKRGV